MTAALAVPTLGPCLARNESKGDNGVHTRLGLTRSKERTLVLAAKEGDAEARRELVDAYLPSIAGVAHIYRRSRAVDSTELKQEGVVGLLRALERFDPARATPFWAYASWWVRQAMQDLVSQLTWPVVLSDRALRGLARLRDARRGYVHEHRQEPTSSELAAESGITRERVEALTAVEAYPRALDEPLDNGHGGASLGDLLADPGAEDEYERVREHVEVDELAALLGDLSERERTILRAHYGLDGAQQTLRQLGSRLGMSAERVRQIEQQALGKLRNAPALAQI